MRVYVSSFLFYYYYYHYFFFFWGGGGSENLIFMEEADFVDTFFWLISMHLQGFS